MFSSILLLALVYASLEIQAPALESLPLERRRYQGKSTGYSCFGSKGKENAEHATGEPPLKMSLQYSTTEEDVISYAAAVYGDGVIDVGDWDNEAQKKAGKLPACVQFVLVKHTDEKVAGLRFFSQGEKHQSKRFGWDIPSSDLVAAPEGKCLGDIKLSGEDKLERICLKFNADA